MNYNDFFFLSAEEVFLFGRVFFLAGWGGLLVGGFFKDNPYYLFCFSSF